MIGLVDKKHIPARGEIPSCIENIVFIPLNANVSKISKVIKQHWFSLQQAKTPHAVHHCGYCPHKTFTGQQNQLAAFLYAGMTSKQIAYKMANRSENGAGASKRVNDEIPLKNRS
ncbi:LuxR family transcriptional regulator [Citrobacter koseri]|nr:LuxR family transcriptional regulator [Citrobacter koseri]